MVVLAEYRCPVCGQSVEADPRAKEAACSNGHPTAKMEKEEEEE